MLAKYIIRNVARRNGKTATFMPKPLFGDNGSGMHTHLTLWKDNQPLLAGQGYAGLSDLGIHAIGGLLKHAAALCAFANPTTNSYKRLVPGFEAPTKISYSRRNRAAIIRIPVNSPSPRSRRIEYRGPDSAANPYLLFSAMLMAVLDGIQNKLRPGEPLDKDIYDLQPEELDDRPDHPALAGSLARSPQGRPRVPAPRRRLHPRRHRHLDLVQADPTKSRRSGSVRIPTSSRSITTCEHRVSRIKDDATPACSSDGGLRSGGRLLGTQGVQNERDRAGDQHVVGEVEDRAVEADRIDVEVDEVADVPERQPVIAIAHRTGHDQAQGDGQHPARGRSQDEEVIAE